MWYKDYKSLFQVDMVKHELGVTSCELRVTSYELKALKLQLKFKSESSNSRVASSILLFIISNSRITSLNP